MDNKMGSKQDAMPTKEAITWRLWSRFGNKLSETTANKGRQNIVTKYSTALL